MKKAFNLLMLGALLSLSTGAHGQQPEQPPASTAGNKDVDPALPSASRLLFLNKHAEPSVTLPGNFEEIQKRLADAAPAERTALIVGLTKDIPALEKLDLKDAKSLGEALANSNLSPETSKDVIAGYLRKGNEMGPELWGGGGFTISGPDHLKGLGLGGSQAGTELTKKIAELERKYESLYVVAKELNEIVSTLQEKIAELEKKGDGK